MFLVYRKRMTVCALGLVVLGAVGLVLDVLFARGANWWAHALALGLGLTGLIEARLLIPWLVNRQGSDGS